MTFRLKIIQVGKFPYLVEFDETPRFWYPRVAHDAWIDFNTQTVEIRPSERRKISFFSLFFPFLPPFLFSYVFSLSLSLLAELIPLGNFLPFSSSPPYLPLVSLSHFLFISFLSSYWFSFFLFFLFSFLVLIPPNLSFVCSHSHNFFFIYFDLFDFIPFIIQFDTRLNMSHPCKCHVSLATPHAYHTMCPSPRVPCGITWSCHVSPDTRCLEKSEILAVSEFNEIQLGS